MRELSAKALLEHYPPKKMPKREDTSCSAICWASCNQRLAGLSKAIVTRTNRNQGRTEQA